MKIGFGLMTFAASFALTANRNLLKALRRSNETLDSFRNLIGSYGADKIDRDLSLFHKAEVEERMEPIPHFAVCRTGVTKKHDVIKVAYDPADPDDREYKRIFAEERAEMLNEKP